MIRILLVEDKERQLKRMKEILEGEFPDYEIQTASNLKQATDIIDKLKAFSLVIVDYLLAEQGDETGYKLLEYCQNHLSDVPVIIITAYGQDSDKEVCAKLSFQKGAFDFMHKPVDYDELIERIKRALDISAALA